LRQLLAKGYSGQQVRYLLLQTHYRTQLNFTFAGLEGAGATLVRLSDFILRLKAVRHAKMHKALDLILDRALPETAEKKGICQRILTDMQAQKDKDILDPALLKPILERSLEKSEEKGKLLKEILSESKEVKERAILRSVLDRVLTDPRLSQKILTQVIHDVRGEKEKDLLDPALVGPILRKSLQEMPVGKQAVEEVLRDLKVKKNHGFILPLLEKTLHEFTAALADDLNISAALATLFDMVREVNTLCDQEKIGISEAEDVLDFLKKIDQVLGVLPLKSSEEVIPRELIQALERRERARIEKDWQTADECRVVISQAGYLIEDTPQGARLKKRHDD
jgi:cysteinyl-tRNA synthetase